MKINRFAVKIAEIEGGKTQVSIAQISEILSIINKQTGGLLYLLIRLKREK